MVAIHSIISLKKTRKHFHYLFTSFQVSDDFVEIIPYKSFSLYMVFYIMLDSLKLISDIVEYPAVVVSLILTLPSNLQLRCYKFLVSSIYWLPYIEPLLRGGVIKIWKKNVICNLQFKVKTSFIDPGFIYKRQLPSHL